jgi:hypothetical protein
MKKVVLTFGVISGVIIFTFVFVTATLCEMDLVPFDRMQILGYLSFVISLSMIFFGIKSYRDNYAGGRITFWKGVKIGVLISLIASVFYFAGGAAYNIANPGFVDRITVKFTEHQEKTMREQGRPQAEIDTAVQQVKDIIKMMENPFIAFAIFFIELFPIGVLISLVSAAILRRKEVLPPAAAA